MRGINIKDGILSIDLQDVDVSFDIHNNVFSVCCSQKQRSLVDQLKRNQEVAQSYVHTSEPQCADDILNMIRNREVSEFQKHLDEHLK